MVVHYYSVQTSASGSAKGTYSVSSLVMQHWYLWAATGCLNFKGPDSLAACQTLANLCVLQHYETTTEVGSTLLPLGRLPPRWCC